MRKYDIPHVANPRINYYPVKELGEMTLEEIVKKYIKTCGKADGNVAVCSKCKTPCEHGKRAIQLLANKIYDNPPIPLYDGKTMIERAKEENMKRREAEKNGELLPVNSDNMSTLFNALEKAKQDALGKEAPQPKKESKKAKIKRGEWWEPSLESGDQVQWLIDNMELSKTQAKSKIYQYKWAHGMIETKNKKEEQKVETKPQAELPKEEIKQEEPKIENGSIETKIEWLMHQQTKLEKEMAEYQKLYDESKAKYEKIKQKIDILCSAMDILND